MLKYFNFDIVFQEIPDEVTLAINISNCPCHCPGCHSKFLWDDVGIELTTKELDRLIEQVADSITCVCFMGGDAEPECINELIKHVTKVYAPIKVGWYTGKTIVSKAINLSWLDYVKVAPYIERLGGLKSPQSNQKQYKVIHPHQKHIIADVFNNSALSFFYLRYLHN